MYVGIFLAARKKLLVPVGSFRELLYSNFRSLSPNYPTMSDGDDSTGRTSDPGLLRL